MKTPNDPAHPPAPADQPRARTRRPYVVAMLLGTALSTLSASPTVAAQAPETTLRAVTDLSRYCTTCWRNAHLPADCWGDCTQEVLSRLLQTIPAERWVALLQTEGEDRQELLRAIDAVKKRTQRSLKRTHPLAGVVADHRDGHERARADQREVVRVAATELLTARQQRILQLSFEGWQVHEIAEEMQLPPERVSDEKYKAVRKLRDHLCRTS
ncbi:MAG: sigma-70 family RNA polymerase sigma factor [Gemmataceae bacterium]|nr:sigma-70 family RNA polymerase sigma factor [Gemmataceae bacterium]